MYVTHLTIKNLRTIALAEIAFAVPRLPSEASSGPSSALRNVTVLLGDNGAGKTTVLRAVAMAAMNGVLARGSGFVPYSLVRCVRGIPQIQGARVGGEFLLYEPQDNLPGTIEPTLWLDDGRWVFGDRFSSSSTLEPESVDEPPWSDVLDADRSIAGLIVGYGVDRRINSQHASDPESRFERHMPRYARLASLFEEGVSLVPLSAWLPRYRTENRSRHKQVLALFDKVLPDVTIDPEPKEGEYLFNLRGSALPFAALSDGYRVFLGWFSDLLYHICLGAPSGHRLDQTTGIALIDEVDLHLHPGWQQTVVERVAKALPHMQFLFTTHSPLVVGSLHRNNVLLLSDRDVGDGVRETVITRPSAETFGLGVEQLLTGEPFGLESTRAPAFVEKLQRVSKKAREGDSNAAMHFLRMVTLGAAGEAEERPLPQKTRAVAKKPAVRKRPA